MTRRFSILGKLSERLLTYLRIHLQKNNTSSSCFFLKTIVDCCGYTLSLSLSTTTILNVPLTFFQAKEFEIAILFFRGAFMRCITILCATYGHHMLQLLPFVLFPFQ